MCLLKVEVEVKESIIDRKMEVCSAKLETELKEAPRDLERDACSAKLEVKAIELVSDLNSEVCSTKFVAGTNEEVIDLNSEVCSTKLDVKLIDADSPLKNCLVSDPVRLRDPVRVLNSDDSLVSVDVGATESVKTLARPFV